MRKLWLLLFGTALAMAFMSATLCCVSFTPRLNAGLSTDKVFPRKSFLFVEKKTTFFLCTTNQCKMVFSGKMTGSASVIYHNETRTFVLTAAHMVWMKPISFFRKIKFETQGKLKSVDSWTLIDINGKKYKGIKVVKSNKESDLAILSIKKAKIPALEISDQAPRIADKLYNVGAPTGMFGKDMVLLYEGRFLGYYQDERRTAFKLKVAITNIPVAGGSSGSPILNSCGKVVGMVSAVNRSFHHISISPTWKQLSEFVKKHLRKYGYGMCMNPELQPNPSKEPVAPDLRQFK